MISKTPHFIFSRLAEWNDARDFQQKARTPVSK